MAYVIRKGRVASGVGIASTAFAGAREELADYFGQPPQAGTLNVLLRWPMLFHPAAAIPFPDSPVMKQHGAWPVRMLGHPALLVRWAWCPLHVAEIISPVSFRAAHDLADGDAVSLEIEKALVLRLSVRNIIAWAAMWGLGRKAYLDKTYVQTLMAENPRAYKLAGQPVLQPANSANSCSPLPFGSQGPSSC